MADKNFTVKITLEEANTIRDALLVYQAQILEVPMQDLNDLDKVTVGRIDTLLRRDF
jgi:hypothetical protein